MNEFLSTNPWTIVTVTGVVSGVFLLLSLLICRMCVPRERTKWILFLGISIPVVLATAFLIVSTVSLNLVSLTKGPVHWHADFRMYNCGQEIELEEPHGLSNRIGEELIHEHGDKRIHIEGRVLNMEDVSLQAFFRSIGGDFYTDSIALPTDGLEIFTDGRVCPNGVIAKVQTFVWSVENGKATQRKIEDGPAFIPSPHTDVPPGDCIIIEFGPERERTDKICDSYKLAEQKGVLEITD